MGKKFLDKSLKLKRLIGNICSPFSREAENRKIILIYHSVDGGPDSTCLDKFREQMGWLARHTDVISLDKILTGRNLIKNGGRIKVALTFDDGYRSLFDTVTPVLAEYGLVATVYLNTGWIGETGRKASVTALGHYNEEQFLTWREVEALQQAGWIIGSHGVNHLDLTDQEAKVVEEELEDSKREIETRSGQPCEYFAYTWGRFSPPLQRALREAGYLGAVSGLHGPVTSTSDSFAVPRIDVRAEYELSDFQNLVEGYWDFLGFKQRVMCKLV